MHACTSRGCLEPYLNLLCLSLCLRSACSLDLTCRSCSPPLHSHTTLAGHGHECGCTETPQQRLHARSLPDSAGRQLVLLQASGVKLLQSRLHMTSFLHQGLLLLTNRRLMAQIHLSIALNLLNIHSDVSCEPWLHKCTNENGSTRTIVSIPDPAFRQEPSVLSAMDSPRQLIKTYGIADPAACMSAPYPEAAALQPRSPYVLGHIADAVLLRHMREPTGQIAQGSLAGQPCELQLTTTISGMAHMLARTLPAWRRPGFPGRKAPAPARSLTAQALRLPPHSCFGLRLAPGLTRVLIESQVEVIYPTSDELKCRKIRPVCKPGGSHQRMLHIQLIQLNQRSAMTAKDMIKAKNNPYVSMRLPGMA